MKTLISFCSISLLAASAFADIQDPPANDYGPTRKLGRGLANVTFCPNELIHTLCQINDREGNEAAAGYGMVRGLGRVFARAGFGVYEVATFPFPTFWSSYRPALQERSSVDSWRLFRVSTGAWLADALQLLPPLHRILSHLRFSQKRLPLSDGSLFFFA
jgi:putative exosortase-associated protein (TIGR04073 family)